MLGFLLMGIVTVLVLYVLFAKFYPALAFRYMGTGERKARAEYGRIKREHPDAPEAKLSEAEYVEGFIRKAPSPWKYALIAAALLFLGLPMSCVVGIAGFSQ
jgi:hypothetical protein